MVHQVSPKHLRRYTNEFGYRYNRQETPNVKFENAISGANKKTLTYQKLIDGITNQTLIKSVQSLQKRNKIKIFLIDLMILFSDQFASRS